MSSQLSQLAETGDVSPVAANLPPVGEQLRMARKARGLEVPDVAQTLKLGPRQVEALENGDWSVLPGQTFVRGFVRNYARLVQIDPAPLMAQLDGVLEKPVNRLQTQEGAQAEMPRSGGAGSRRDRAVVLIGVGLVALAALTYFLLPNDLSALRENTQSLLDSLGRKDEAVPAPVVQTPMPAPTTTPTPAAASPTEPVFPPGSTPQQVMNPQALTPADLVVAEKGISLPTPKAADKVAGAPQIRFLVEKDSWLEVRDRDNKQIFSQRLSAGTEQTLAGQGPLSLVVGYAPGVRLFWHGQAIDLAPHTRGDVARLVLE